MVRDVEQAGVSRLDLPGDNVRRFRNSWICGSECDGPNAVDGDLNHSSRAHRRLPSVPVIPTSADSAEGYSDVVHLLNTHDVLVIFVQHSQSHDASIAARPNRGQVFLYIDQNFIGGFYASGVLDGI